MIYSTLDVIRLNFFEVARAAFFSKYLTDVTCLNFFEVARAAFFSKYYSPRHEVRSSAHRTSPLTMHNGQIPADLIPGRSNYMFMSVSKLFVLEKYIHSLPESNRLVHLTDLVCSEEALLDARRDTVK